MHVAFSREGSEKRYVQNLFQEHAEELRTLILTQGAHVYVCGDAHRMARYVFSTMADIVAEDEQFRGSKENARDYLKDLKTRGRWSEDVW